MAIFNEIGLNPVPFGTDPKEKKDAANSDYDHRIATLYGQYVKALRKDRNLIHLGEK